MCSSLAQQQVKTKPSFLRPGGDLHRTAGRQQQQQQQQ
jgi:hypothetical protein